MRAIFLKSRVTANVKEVVLIIPSHMADIGTITVATAILIRGMTIIMIIKYIKTEASLYAFSHEFDCFEIKCIFILD